MVEFEVGDALGTLSEPEGRLLGALPIHLDQPPILGPDHVPDGRNQHPHQRRQRRPMAIVLAVGALATWIPARGAMRVDPVQLLRSS
jgi:hypothetical protein